MCSEGRYWVRYSLKLISYLQYHQQQYSINLSMFPLNYLYTNANLLYLCILILLLHLPGSSPLHNTEEAHVAAIAPRVKSNWKSIRVEAHGIFQQRNSVNKDKWHLNNIWMWWQGGQFPTQSRTQNFYIVNTV